MVEITVQGAPLGAAVEKAARRGLARIESPPKTQVLFAESFVDEVRRETGSTTYGVDRGVGVVAARTINRSPQSPLIIVNSREVQRLGVADTERLLAHEGGHAVLYARGEHVGAGFRQLVDHQWKWGMLCIGGLALEEYRIEATLRSLGYGPGDTVQGNTHLEDSLVNLNAELIWALIDPEDTSPATMANRVWIAQDHFTKLLAYMAPYVGHELAANPLELSSGGTRHWRDYVGPLWQDRQGVYQRLDDVQTNISHEDYSAALLDVFALESNQLRRFGFEASGTDELQVFRRLATDRRCMERHAAAVRDADHGPRD